MAKKTHWSGVNEAGTVLGMKIMLWVYRVLGLRGFRIILGPVMLYYFFVRKEERLASEQFLSKVAQFQKDNSAGQLSSFKHFMMFGEVLLDKFLAWMGEFGKNDVVFESPGVIPASSKGGIIIVSHLGNSEICGALMEHLPDLKITALVHNKHAEKFNSLLNKINKNNKVNIMQVTEMTPATAMLLSERVDAGEYIIIAGDRTPVTGPQRVSLVDFFGTPAEFPQGAFILASLLKCPVFLMFCLKKSGRYHIFIEKFAEQLKLPRKDKEHGLNKAVQEYAYRLQSYCQEFPLQWFNFFPFWESKTVKISSINED